MGTEARRRRAALKASIKRRDVDVVALLEGRCDPDVEEVALGIPIADLLGSVPGVGPLKIDWLLEGWARPRARLIELSPRVREQLANAMKREAADGHD